MASPVLPVDGDARVLKGHIVIRDVTSSVVVGQQNVTDGPATLKTIVLDNTASLQVTTGGCRKAYAKFYDIISDALVVTSAPRMVIPVQAGIIDGAADNVNVLGKHTVHVIGGVPFRNGISVLASQTPGDVNTTPVAAAGDFDIELLTE